MVTGRTLVLLVGPADSGADVVAQVLQGLGFRVPPAEWVADFHAKLSGRAGVQVADARPGAWAAAADVGFDAAAERRLRKWLDQQFATTGDVVVGDPRLPWFVPLWRRSAEAIGASVRFVSMVRHPAAMADGTDRSSGAWEREVARAAAWLNQTLYIERATRDAPRVFVRHDDMVEDWPRAIGRVGASLDLALVRDAPAYAIRRVHRSVDVRPPAPGRDARGIPAPLRAHVDEVWTLVSALADAPGSAADTPEDRLDAIRAAYVELYREAEAMTQSSRDASPRTSVQPDQPVAARLARRVPRRVRDMVPVPWRRRAARALRR